MAEQTAQGGAAEAAQDPQGEGSLKETLISVIIAFALAFVFRSFVIEPFVIPTGSMAPTLMGAHVRTHSPYSGYQWPANPRDYIDRRRQAPAPVQGSRRPVMVGGRIATPGPITLTDPMTGLEVERSDAPLRNGDRILVLKYLYTIRGPERFDVVVFKNPENPTENFIKRLVGLPGEELWIADGDLFVRRPDAEDESLRQWRVQRKGRRIQEEVWLPVFSSEYAPTTLDASSAWRGPWTGAGWRREGIAYRAESGAGPLVWDIDRWPIEDWVPYNEPVGQQRGAGHFPVSDVRIRAGVEPDEPGALFAISLRAREHEFEASIGAGAASIRMRPVGAEAWTDLASGPAPELAPGRIANIEFEHVDQALRLRASGRTFAEAAYDWGPEERLARAMRLDGSDYADPRPYRPPAVQLSVAGAAATLHRLGLDRDLYWRTGREGGRYFRATAPGSTFTLHEDQFFVLGDNSPHSRDSRRWDRVDPWVARQYDDRVGVVPRGLLMGKAFFVYFPAPHPDVRIPLVDLPLAPDFGRLRFIR